MAAGKQASGVHCFLPENPAAALRDVFLDYPISWQFYRTGISGGLFKKNQETPRHRIFYVLQHKPCPFHNPETRPA